MTWKRQLLIALALIVCSPLAAHAQSMSCVTDPFGNGTAYGNVVSVTGVESYPLFIDCFNGTGTTATLSTAFSGTNSGDMSIGATVPAWPVYYVWNGVGPSTPPTEGTYAACGSTLAAGAYCAYPIEVAPAATGSRSGTFTVSWTGPSGSPATFNFTWTGVTGTALPACGSTLTSSDFYYTTSDISCPDTSFTISSGTVDVNLNGHMITWGTSGNSAPNSGPMYDDFHLTTNTAGTSIENGSLVEGSCLNGSSFSSVQGGAAVNLFGGQLGNTGTVHDVYFKFCSDSAAALEGSSSGSSSNGGVFYNWYVQNNKVTAQRRGYQMGYAAYDSNWGNSTPGSASFHNIVCNGGPQGCIGWHTSGLTESNVIANVGNPNGLPTGSSGSLNCDTSSGNPYTDQSGSTPSNPGTECSNDFAFDSANGGTVENNYGVVQEARGLWVGPWGVSNKNVTVTQNYVIAKEFANNSEYYSGGQQCEISGAYGIEMNQSVNGSDTGGAISVTNNTFIAIATTQCPGNGVSVSNTTSSNPTYSVSNNWFECDRATGSTQECAGLRDDAKQYTPYGPLTISNSTIRGDSQVFYVYYDGAPSLTCVSCSIGSGTNPASSGFLTFDFENCGANNDPWYFIDPAFTGSASLANYKFAGCGASASYYGEFTYNVHVQNGSSAPIVGAAVSAVDNQGGTSNAGVTPAPYSCTTNSSGNCSFVVNYIQYAGSTTGSVTTTNYSPVAFTITATNCTTKNYNETIAATTNDTQTMTCSGGGGSPAAPGNPLIWLAKLVRSAI